MDNFERLRTKHQDIVDAVACCMDFFRYQSEVLWISYLFEETWELYEFEKWMDGDGSGGFDETLAPLSQAYVALERIGEESYKRMIQALKRGQWIPTRDQMDLFGFEISEINLDDLDRDACGLFATEESSHDVTRNFILFCQFLKRYFEEH